MPEHLQKSLDMIEKYLESVPDDVFYKEYMKHENRHGPTVDELVQNFRGLNDENTNRNSNY